MDLFPSLQASSLHYGLDRVFHADVLAILRFSNSQPGFWRHPEHGAKKLVKVPTLFPIYDQIKDKLYCFVETKNKEA